MAGERSRIEDLVEYPAEDLDVELKAWLDPANDADRAKIAKALIALCNHGGGYLLIGFSDDGTPSAPRPADLGSYTQDQINNIVMRYAEPPFHCRVELVTRRTSGEPFPVVIVPGHQSVPVRSRRAGPNGQIVDDNVYYIRRPGPRSEPPQSAAEWDQLVQRCVRNGREQLVDTIRTILSSSATPAPPQPAPILRFLEEWTQASRREWQLAVEALPDDSPARFRYGGYEISYTLEGRVRPTTLQQFRQVLDESVIRYSGWPPWLVPRRQEMEPFVRGNAIHCHVLGEDPAHCDFWRAMPGPFMYLIRGFQEDGLAGTPPGTVLDVVLPVWRMSECLLHSASLASRALDGAGSVLIKIRYWGLQGRELTAIDGRRAIYPGRISRDDEYRTQASISTSSIADHLPELLPSLLNDLYAMFGFFQPAQEFYAEEVGRMLRRVI